MRKKTTGVPEHITEQLDSLTLELREIGIHYIGHGIVSLEGNHSGYFSNRIWQQVYVGSKFFHQEPILDAFKENPFDYVHWNYVHSNEVANMRREQVGILSGFTAATFHNNFFGFLNIGFASEKDTMLFSQQYKPLLINYHQHFDNIHLAWRKEALID